jgi:hypothetical protein
MKMRMAVGAVALATVVIGSASSAEAQSGSTAAAQAPQDAAAIVATIGKNMQALTSYTFQQRIQVSYDSEVKSTTLNQVSFDGTGAPVITQLSESVPPQKEGRLGHRIRDKKKEEIQQDVKNISAVAKGYILLDKAHLEQVAKTAAVSYQGQNIILAVKDLMQQGDAVTITALASNMTRVAMQVTTTADNAPMTINATYATLESGLNYNSHYVVASPSQKIELMVDTLNYMPKQ